MMAENKRTTKGEIDMASVTSTSSSLGNTSLRGFGGMASGIDRDAIIEQMTLGTQTKISNKKGDMQSLSWKQEAYQSISDKILDLQDNYFSFTGQTNLKYASAFAKNSISVLGNEDSTALVKATGTSDMVDYLSIQGVKQLATAATTMSGEKKTKAIDSKITASSLTNDVNSVSQLAGRRLNFGIYDESKGTWSNESYFEFPTTYTEEVMENGETKKVTKSIDYTAEPEKLVEQLNKALKDQDFKFRFKISEDGNSITLSETAGTFGNIRIKNTNTSSDALTGLGYKGDSTNGIKMSDFKVDMSDFQNSYIKKQNMVEYLTDKSLSVTYSGQTKSVKLLTEEDVKDGMSLEDLQKAIQSHMDSAFGSGKIDVKIEGMGDDAHLSFDTKERDVTNDDGSAGTIKPQITISGDAELLKNLGIDKNASNKVSTNSSIWDNMEKLGFTGITHAEKIEEPKEPLEPVEPKKPFEPEKPKKGEGQTQEEFEASKEYQDWKTAHEAWENGVPQDPGDPGAEPEKPENTEGQSQEDFEASEAYKTWKENYEAWYDKSVKKQEYEQYKTDHDAWETEHKTWKTEHETWKTEHDAWEAANQADGGYEHERAELQKQLDNFKINGVKIEGLTVDMTINEMIDKINATKDAGVKASFFGNENKLVLVATQTGSGREIKLEGAAQTIFEMDGDGKLGKATVDGGKDAEIRVSYGNGLSTTVTSATNTFDLEGLSVTVSGTFGYKTVTNADDGSTRQVIDDSKAVSFSAKADVDGMTEKVKKFFEDYNALVEEINTQITTKPDKSYGPLTDEQKEEMDDKSIENWEKKAKQGLLYGDSTMRELSMDIQSIFSQLLGNGANYEDLKEMGITFSDDYLDGGKIVFDEAKFKSAMSTDPEKVSNVFTGGGDVKKGLTKIMEDTFTVYATKYASKNSNGINGKGSYGRLIEEAGSEKIPSSIQNNLIYTQLKEMEEQIKKFQEQLKNEQDRYISQFSTMETLINTMNTQSSYLSSLQG